MKLASLKYDLSAFGRRVVGVDQAKDRALFDMDTQRSV